MSTRSIQTQRRNPPGLWIVGLILLAMLAFILVRKSDELTVTHHRNSLSLNSTGPAVTGSWEQADRNAPLVRYPEIVNLDIMVRADEQYAIYAVERSVLFEKGASAFRAGTEEPLRQIARSIRQRFESGRMLISGTADAEEPGNRTLALARANALRRWLAEQGLEERNMDVEAGAATVLAGEQARPRDQVEILIHR